MRSRSKINQELASTQYVAYSPTYWAPGRPASELEIGQDLDLLRAMWNGLITYGTRGALRTIPRLAREAGFERLILGVYNITDPEELAEAYELVEAYPSLIRAVCLGNEGLSFKLYTHEQLVETIREFRRRFPQLLLTTSEPIFAWGERQLLSEVDFCFPIIHPWIHEIFKHDPTSAAMWTIQAAQRLQILSDKAVLVKETGFPADDEHYPSEHQVTFWEVLLRELGAFTQNVHLAVFEAFDIPDKLHFAARTHWDCHWGVFDKDRRPKAVVEVLRQHLGVPPIDPVEASAIRVEDRETVSVVITTRDRPEFLRQSIGSVLSQGAALSRLILVNDDNGNTEVQAICSSYAGHPCVRYLRLEGGGSSGSARNAGLREVDSRYVCFLDDDDAFLPGKLAHHLELFHAHPSTAFAGTAAEVVDQDGLPCARSGSPDFFPGAPLSSMLAFCRLVHSSVMMRTSVLRMHGGYLEHFEGEDWELWCRLLREGETMHYLASPLTRYRRHAMNISTPEYVRRAVRNVLSRHLDLPSAKLIQPLPYDPRSGELLKSAILIIHGWYEEALALVGELDVPAARLARFISYRELGRYGEALGELEEWSDRLGLQEQLCARLTVHAERFNRRRHAAIVGSPALLFEQRLLAQDALAAATSARHVPELSRYFHQSPKNINIESSREDANEDIFFRRVSLTSC